MTESWWVEVAKQVPALVLFVYVILTIVNRFLTHIDTTHEACMNSHAEISAKVTEATNSAITFQQEMTRDNRALTEKAIAHIDKGNAFLAVNIHALEKVQKQGS